MKRLKHPFVGLLSQRMSRATMEVLRLNCSAFLLACFFIHSSFSVAAEFIDLYSVKLAIDSEAKRERLLASQKALETVFVRATGDMDAVKKYPVLAKNIASADQFLSVRLSHFLPFDDQQCLYLSSFRSIELLALLSTLERPYAATALMRDWLLHNWWPKYLSICQIVTPHSTIFCRSPA